jgi:tetratricopeptide (TPR) repeat protein
VSGGRAVLAIILVLVAGAAGTLVAGTVVAGDLPPVAHPDLEALDPAVREQLGQLRAQVDALFADAPASQEAVAALALLAEAYLAYDFLEAAEAGLQASLDRGFRPFRSAYLLGYVQESQGRLSEAAATLRRALAVRPRDAASLVRLGKVLLGGIAPQEAPPLFERALAADPECAAASYGLGEAARMRGDHEAAVSHFQAALERRPGLTQARYALALALRRVGDVEAAAAEMEQVDLERVLVSGGNWEGCADPVLNEVSSLATSASAYVMRGAIAFFQGDVEREIAEYGKAVAANPEDAIARKSLAAALFRQGAVEAALEQFLEAVRLEPTDATYRYDLGQIQRARGALDEAEAQYREAVRLNPRFAEPLLRLAELALERRAAEPALEHSRRLLEIDPANALARTLLAKALLLANRPDEAVAELGRLLDDHPPEDPRQHLELASMTLLMGDAERAETHLRAIADQPDAAPEIRALARFRLGLLQLGLGDPEAAIATIEQALELDPDLPEGREALAAARQALADSTP